MDRDNSLLEDEGIDDSIWDSPVKMQDDRSQNPQAANNKSNFGRPTLQEQQEQDETLRRELDSVRKVNQAIEGVIESLGKAKDNMKTVNNTVDAASTLLNTWTRILSQTEHNQRLILDPNWHGASQDIADLDEEAMEKQRAAERREIEEQERKYAAAKLADAEENRKAELAAKQGKISTSRGTSRISSAGRGMRSTSSTSYVQMGNSSSASSNNVGRGTASTRRTTSGIGRGGAGRGAKPRG